LTTFSLID